MSMHVYNKTLINESSAVDPLWTTLPNSSAHKIDHARRHYKSSRVWLTLTKGASLTV